MSLYRLIAVLILAVYLLSPDLVDTWSHSERSWYSPFIAWFILILLVAWLEHKRGRNDL